MFWERRTSMPDNYNFASAGQQSLTTASLHQLESVDGSSAVILGNVMGVSSKPGLSGDMEGARMAFIDR